MKYKAILLLIVPLIFAACSTSTETRQDERFVKDQGSTAVDEVTPEGKSDDVSNDVMAVDESSEDSSSEVPPGESEPTSGVDCYPEGTHAIGMSIADQFEEITTYQEVMNWFCNGAEFEDILNALLTEELSGIDAENFLEMIAAGSSWDDIWLELGITEE